MNSSATKKPNLKTEAIAGITTFFTMAYIVIVNPQILSADGKTGMAFTGVLTATVLICFTMTMLMGVYAKLPFAVAPGMGINAFFTYVVLMTSSKAGPASSLFIVSCVTNPGHRILEATRNEESSLNVVRGSLAGRILGLSGERPASS